MIDTGSPPTVVPKDFAQSRGSDFHSSKVVPRLVAANNTPIKTYGYCTIHPKMAGQSYNFKAIVADVAVPIIGLDFFQEATNVVIDPTAKTVKPKDVIAQIMENTKVFEKYPSLVTHDVGKTESLTIPLSIDTDSNRPVFSKARPLYGEKREEIEKELLAWEKDGIIERVSDAIQWASPIHAVKKPNGDWRVCGDFRRLNSITKTDRYPLPRMSDFNSRMAGSSYFSKIDLQRAYHQIKVAEEDTHKTTINTTLGLFKFLRVPFGLKNAGGIFQRNINNILKDFSHFLFVYLDDIIIFSSDYDQHMKHVEMVLERLAKHKILVNQKKCVIATTQLDFLGHTVTSAGISIPKTRVKSITDYPQPNSAKELERFLGLVAFVHRFVPNASSLSAPLHELRKIKIGARFISAWGARHSKAFVSVKKAIVNAASLAHPDPHAETELWTDASNNGVGSVLVQKINNHWKPVSFWSKSFNSAQQNYAPYDKELLAISFSVAHFRHFIEGQKVTVRTDHRPLVFALKNAPEDATPLQRRHLNYISQFIDEVHYRRGTENLIADALSRSNNIELLGEDEFMEEPMFKICKVTQKSVLPSPAEFRTGQEEDYHLQDWIKRHRENSSNYKPNLVPCADADVEVWATVKEGDQVPKILVPTKYQRAVFDHFHSPSHAGFKSCLETIKKTHYWPNFAEDVKRWTSTCENCQRNKIGRHTQSYLEELPQPTARFSHVHIDLVNMGHTISGFNHLFTIIDRWTSWPEAIPVKTTDARTCAQALVDNWISRMGTPQLITSDRGKQFAGKVWSEMNKILGIKQIHTTAYNPKANGKVERWHHSLKSSLRCRLDGAKNWLSELPLVLLGLRNSPNCDTKVSPALLTYGQSLDLPGQMVLPKSKPQDLTSFGNELSKAMSAQSYNSPFWHKGDSRKTFVPPDLNTSTHVLIRNDGIIPTLAPRYKGPFKVIQRRKKAYKLDVAGKIETVSIDRLVPFHE